jgi:membrane protein
MKFFIEGVQKGAISTRAAAISFKLFLAIFPMLIVLVMIIPYVPIDNFKGFLLENLQLYFPGDSLVWIQQALKQLFFHEHGSLLSFAFVLVLFSASNSVNAILQGFNRSYNIEKRGNIFVVRGASVVLMLILSFLITLAVALILFSGKVFGYLLEKDILPSQGVVYLLEVVRWIITLLLIYSTVSILYNAGDMRRKRWKIFSAGASFATLFFLISSLGFAWFVTDVVNFTKAYASLGSIMVLLMWMNFVSTILLLGFELNVSIHRAKRSHNEELLLSEEDDQAIDAF